MPEQRFLGPAELADRYGVPVKTVYAWTYTGFLPPPLRLGKHRRWRLTDLLAWEETRIGKAQT